MKKILLATLIILFSGSICNAEELDNIFTHDPQTNVELHGYLEYDEVPQDTIYLQDQEDEAAQNAVNLDENVYKANLKFKTPQKYGSKSLISNKIKQTPAYNSKTMEAASKFSTLEYGIQPISSSYSTKKGNISLGTTYDSSISGAQRNYSTGFFTKYEGKRYAMTSAFSKSTNSNYDEYNNKVYFAPELKITKRLSLLDVIQTDITQTNKSNEIVLRYNPNFKNHADEVIFELGAGQSYYQNNYINSSLRFSTRFKL